MGALDDLLQSHADDIKAVAERLSDVLPADGCDDVFLLRYILSFKNASTKELDETLRYSIQWRKDNADILKSIQNGGIIPNETLINQFQVVGVHKAKLDGGPVFYVRTGLCNPRGLMDKVPFKEVLEYFTLSSARVALICDAETRARREIVKQITVIDHQGFSFSRTDSRFFKVIGESSKVNEQLFPQMLERTVHVNAPSMATWFFNSVLKPLMAKKSAEKTIFCSGSSKGRNITECPYIALSLPLDRVPTFLGGQCSCAGGCVGGAPNTQKTPINDVSDDGFVSVSVSARSRHVMDLPVAKGSVVEYTIKSEPGQRITSSIEFLSGLGSDAKVVVVKEQTDNELISGTFVAPESGMFTQVFDNSKSWIKSKIVWFKTYPVH